MDVGISVLSTLQEQDNREILRSGIRRFFVVNGYEEVVSFLRHWNFSASESRHLRTGDFSTMYTSLPLAQLKNNVAFALAEAWIYMADKFSCEETEMRLVWNSDAPCSWVRIRSSSREKLHSSNKHSFTIEELQRLISWLVDNTFVVNGGVCRRQIIGLPMGTNCAPALCNLCLFAWECQFVEKLLKQKRIEEAKSLHMTFRLIDDVLSVGSTCHDEFFNSCYPTFLTLNDTTLQGW